MNESVIVKFQVNLLNIITRAWTITVFVKEDGQVLTGKIIQGKSYSKFNSLMNLLNSSEKLIVSYDGYKVINFTQF